MKKCVPVFLDFIHKNTSSYKTGVGRENPEYDSIVARIKGKVKRFLGIFGWGVENIFGSW